MNSLLTKTLISFSVYTIIIAGLSIIVSVFLPSVPISHVWPYILGFLFLTTLFAFYLLVKYLNSKMSMFANAFMLVNFGKLILFTVIILMYSWFNRSHAINFTITFFIYYLLLTTYEIVSLLKLQKR